MLHGWEEVGTDIRVIDNFAGGNGDRVRGGGFLVIWGYDDSWILATSGTFRICPDQGMKKCERKPLGV